MREGGLRLPRTLRGNLAADASTARPAPLRLGANGGVVLLRMAICSRPDAPTTALPSPKRRATATSALARAATSLLAPMPAARRPSPRLMAYQENSVRIDPRELPYGERGDRPRSSRSRCRHGEAGASRLVPVRSGQRSALLKIVLRRRRAGSRRRGSANRGRQANLYVARRGEAFVTGLQPANRLTLNWKCAAVACSMCRAARGRPPTRSRAPRAVRLPSASLDENESFGRLLSALAFAVAVVIHGALWRRLASCTISPLILGRRLCPQQPRRTNRHPDPSSRSPATGHW